MRFKFFSRMLLTTDLNLQKPFKKQKLQKNINKNQRGTNVPIIIITTFKKQ